jgi:hypothetical protein
MRDYRPRRGMESLVKKRKRHGTDEIIRKLREAETAMGRGEPLATILQRLQVSENTLYRWRRKYAGVKVADAKRLRDLEKENARLKKIVADQILDIAMLKEVTRGNF